MHHPNVLRSFIEQFKHCPKCGGVLRIKAHQQNSDGKSNEFFISAAGDRLTINVKSGFFVNVEENNFEFSISIVNGHIMYSDQTSKFISLYDLDIILYKECDDCPRPEMFHQSINVLYDRSDSLFVAEPWAEFFSFIYENSYYYFRNDFKARRSFLSVQPLNGKGRNSILNTPFLPFEKFEFGNREKLFAKVNSIRLLV